MKVTRKCGHESTFDEKSFKPFEVADKVSFLSETECELCDKKFLKKREKAKADWAKEQREMAQAAEKQFGFTELRGTPKQVTWGCQIRVRLVSQAFETLGLDEDQFTETVGDPAGQLHSARWWIDHKDIDVQELADALRSALGTSDEGNADENPFV